MAQQNSPQSAAASAPRGRENKRNQSYALRHALDIMDAVADRRYPRGVSLSQLVEASGLNKSTVLRLMAPLLERRIVVRSAEAGTYRLGLRVVEWAETVLSETEIAQVASPHLQGLVERTGETAFLVVYESGDVVYLAKVESPNLIRMSSNIGTRTAAHSTANGKAILAFLPSEEVERLTARGLRAFTPRTITSPEALRAELAKVRARGYATDDQENVADARCIGAPVFDRRGQVAGGISLSGPAFRMDWDRVAALAPLVVATAQAISRDLGYVAGAGPDLGA
jgi:IclR family acetate operon transcriptional repressor